MTKVEELEMCSQVESAYMSWETISVELCASCNKNALQLCTVVHNVIHM